jgi:adenylate cyclase
VGNTGSRHKFRYAPLGKTVNLASRVQGATKYFKCRLLVTDATRAQLDDSFATRCLGQVRVVNIGEAVRLHELVEPGAADWPEAKIEYERALEEFESQNFSNAARILGNWRMEHGTDQPALMLLYRSVQFMVEPPTQFDPVWTLQGK